MVVKVPLYCFFLADVFLPRCECCWFWCDLLVSNFLKVIGFQRQVGL